MSHSYKLALIAIAWLLNAIIGMGVTLVNTQASLQKQVNYQLKVNGFEEWTAEMRGIDLIISGPKPPQGETQHPDESAVIAAIQDVKGVRSVMEVRYPVTRPANSKPDQIWFEVRVYEGEVTVRGDFSSQGQQDEALLPLKDRFGDMNVQDLSGVDQTLTSPFNPRDALREQYWMKRARDFSLGYRAGKVVIQGNVPPELVKEILQQVKRGFPKAKVENRLNREPGAAPDPISSTSKSSAMRQNLEFPSQRTQSLATTSRSYEVAREKSIRIS